MTSCTSLTRAIGGALVLVSILAHEHGSAQSLGDVAKRETERRKAVPSGKVYTGEALRPAPAPSSVPDAGKQVDAAQPAAPPSEPDVRAGAPQPDEKAPDQKSDEKTWRARMQGERDALQRAEMFAEALQSRINALSADFVARDDPAQRTRIGDDRQKALAELARVQEEIRQHTKNIATIQDDARRAGVPAGWVR